MSTKVNRAPREFIAEAKKYQVFPLDASGAAPIVAARPNITAGRNEFIYSHPMVGLPQGDSPLLLNTSYTVTAEIEVPSTGAEGMLLTSGGRFGGYGFYLKNNKPVWLWNMADLERLKWEGSEPLKPGKHRIEFDFAYAAKGAGTLTGVNDEDYQPPFRFTGKLNQLTIRLDRPTLSASEIRSLEDAMRTKAIGE